MTKGLTLKIFNHTDDTRNLKNAGIDYKYSDCEVGEITFYRIDAISSEEEGDNVYTAISSNGQHYICELPPTEVRKIINVAYENGLLS